MLYNSEVREFVNTRAWPKGLKLTVHESNEPEPHLNFVFYVNNWITLSSHAQLQASLIIKEVMETLRKQGVPCYMAREE